MRELPAGARGILGYFTRHGTAANLLMASVILLGLAAIPNLRAQFFPDVVVERIYVNIEWEGAGAEDIDRSIVNVVEPSLLGIEGVVKVESMAREELARLTVEFEPGWETATGMDGVELALDQIDTLPDDAEEPVIYTTSWSDRVTDVIISGPLAIEQLAQVADEFVARLFDEGVTQTTLHGVTNGQILVEVPSVSLIRHDVSMAEIAQVIAAGAAADPAGEVSGANARVRAGTEQRDARAVGALVLRRNSDGTTLTVADVADVQNLQLNRGEAFFVDDEPAIQLRVERSQRGDAIAIQQTVERIADELRVTLPEGSTIETVRSLSELISARLNILLDNGLVGFGLVIVLLFLCLNARTAICVAAGIPVAMLATLALMYAAGMTINMISLFALIITLGIVVDDAIVVGEHADYRARTLGEAPDVAAENAARRMAAPVFSATVTTVIAFSALMVVEGRFGDLIAAIPFTVVAILVASLVECFLILPNHMRHALTYSRKDAWYDWPSRQVNKGFDWVRETVFRPFMHWVIWARYPVLAGAILLLMSQIASFVRGDVNWIFFNAPEQASVTLNVIMVDDASRDDTLAMLFEIQRAADVASERFAAEHGTDPVLFALSEIGDTNGAPVSATTNKDDDHLGLVRLELIDSDQRSYSGFDFANAVRAEIRSSELVEGIYTRSPRQGPQGEAIDINIFGGDLQTLKDAAEALTQELSQFPEVFGVGDNLSYDRAELSLSLTPQGEALGFEIGALGRTLSNRLGGIEAASFPDGPRTATIRVELPESELTADFLERTLLRSETGEYVPLSDIVTVEERVGFSRILRENGVITITVTGDMNQDDSARATEILSALENQVLPQIAAEFGVGYEFSGLAEQERNFLADATLGLMLCLAGIYIVLAWIFASWTRPFVVMAIIPFGLIGTIYGHAAWDVPLSMFTVIGLLGMTGIIINDSIVLVTTIDEKVKEKARFDAIVDGVCNRLRPVILTTLTTVLGLTPLLFEGSRQAEFLKPTVITLVYGLGFGMLLVLLVVPALMATQKDISDQISALRRSLTTTRGVPAFRVSLTSAAIGTVFWFAATLGAEATGFGSWVSLPIGQTAMQAAFLTFAIGAAAICLLTLCLSAFWSGARRSAL